MKKKSYSPCTYLSHTHFYLWPKRYSSPDNTAFKDDLLLKEETSVSTGGVENIYLSSFHLLFSHSPASGSFSSSVSLSSVLHHNILLTL